MNQATIEDGPVTFRTAPNRPINSATDNIDTDLITFSNDINNLGQVVATGTGAARLSFGVRTDNNGLLTSDFFLENSSFYVTQANAINESGQIAGRAIVAGCNFGCSQPEVFNAVRIDVSSTGTVTMVDLGIGGSGNGINDLGQVVAGQYRTAPNSPVNLETDNIGSLGSGGTSGLDINNLGQVVGRSTTASGETHAFRTATNSVINAATDDLGTLGGDFSAANAINELGQVVGSSELANGDIRAFLFDEDTMFDLNDLIADDVNFVLTEAVGINEKGQIAVNGFFGNDTQTTRAFLLTPVPEPTSMLGMLAFGAGAGILRKRNKQKVKA